LTVVWAPIWLGKEEVFKSVMGFTAFLPQQRLFQKSSVLPLGEKGETAPRPVITTLLLPLAALFRLILYEQLIALFFMTLSGQYFLLKKEKSPLSLKVILARPMIERNRYPRPRALRATGNSNGYFPFAALRA